MSRAVRAALVATCCLSLAAARAQAQSHTTSHDAVHGGKPLTQHARGSFDVKITPQSQDKGDGSTLGRMALDKQFHGDLEGTGKGEMLTASTDKGSAVYVAVERVTGMLGGRSGSFALVHKGMMTKEGQELTIGIVPESGSAQLTGIAGTLKIEITGGKHLYDLEYTLPPQP